MEKKEHLDTGSSKNLSNPHYFVSMGEIMLRLSNPARERLFQSPYLTAIFGGGESNVAVSLANFGVFSRFVSAIPNNSIGDAAISHLRKYDVETKDIIRSGERLGIYFLEFGSGPRASKVIYDRSYSAISEVDSSAFNWHKIFNDAKWFHITGITPAISKSAAQLSLTAVKEAKSHGVTVSCDLNYRSKLWKYGVEPHEIMREIMSFTDIIIANEEDIQKSLNYEIDQKIGGELTHSTYKSLISQVINDYPHISYIAVTLRDSFSADHNDWSAILYEREKGVYYSSKKYPLRDIVDRVGGGDSFAAGLIYGLNFKENAQDALDFAVAASALKHTIFGDCNLVSIEEVDNLIKGDGYGRVQR